ncbi:MAG: circadian clock protein KaiC [Beggiatoa sp. IS2]|nr:MAG: circadian clock protein KaiC [Beggiatoa sp. IS2]
MFIEFENLEPIQKIPTGIEGFEHITMGGLTEGRATLLVGTSGSGKTLLAVESLYRGALQFNRPGIFVTFEERPIDIVRNVKRLGWDLGTLIKEQKMLFVDVSPEPMQTKEIGKYDLSGLIAQIRYTVGRINAKLVVLDSLGSLFGQYTDETTLRYEIFRLTEVLKSMEVTSILTAERLEEYGPISRHGIEEFVSDNVIILRNVLHEERIRRTIQVLKMRGHTHFKGESPFTIDQNGVRILPLSAMELVQSSSNARVSSGNDKLDQLTNGGIFRDSILLVSGPTGCGKTLMCATFAADACKNGEKVLLLGYEESREQLLRNANSWGIDFGYWEKQGLLRISCLYPEAMGLHEHLSLIRDEIAAFKPRRLVVDSVSSMERVASERYFREFVIGLTSHAKQQEICSLFTSTTPNLSGGGSITEAHISTITDIIILLRYVEIAGVLRRGIVVMKMRGSKHDKEIYEFTIDDDGIHIGKPFVNVQNIVLGVPSFLDGVAGDLAKFRDMANTLKETTEIVKDSHKTEN